MKRNYEQIYNQEYDYEQDYDKRDYEEQYDLKYSKWFSTSIDQVIFDNFITVFFRRMLIYLFHIHPSLIFISFISDKIIF